MGEGLKRAKDAARATRPPSKPWRVIVAHDSSADYRSERAAYAAVKDWQDAGVTVRSVWRWENGDWRLYENIDPAPTP